jgi:phosphate uptake regulator
MSDNENGPVERPVQIAGGSTFTLSLPQEWGVAHGLEKGDSLYIYQDSNRLIVTPSTPAESDRTVRIETTDMDESRLDNRLKSAYIEGYTEIRIVSRDGVRDELMQATFRTVDSLLGMEVSETGDTVVVRDHLDTGEIALKRLIVRMRRIALGMQRDAAESVRIDDEPLAQEVVDRDNHIDRLFALFARVLHGGVATASHLAALGVDRPTALYYYKIAMTFEQIADRAQRITDVTETQSSPPDEPMAVRLKELVTTACTVVEHGLRGDSVTIRTYEDLLERIDAVECTLAACSDSDAYWYGTVLESARRTARLGLNVYNMTIESATNERLDSGTQVESESIE